VIGRDLQPGGAIVSELEPDTQLQKPSALGDRFASRSDPGQMTAGLVLIAVGLAVLLARSGFVHLDFMILRLWPLLIIAAGLGKLSRPQPDGSRRGGLLVLIGLWFLLDELNLWRLGQSWPIFLIAYGGKVVWNAVAARPTTARQVE
jgi:hypothetical protein